MDFDQLETFLEVAKHNSFSRAAERRFRTQPAISAQIRAVEEEVGAKLFDRSGGKVALTAAGKAFQKYAEETLERRRAMLTALAEMERVPRGEIVVGAKPGRTAGGERTLAINLGLALDDMAVAPEIYRRAKARGLGTWLPL